MTYPQQPGNWGESSRPGELGQPAQSAGPADPASPGQSTWPGQPEQPAQPTWPGQPEQSAQPPWPGQPGPLGEVIHPPAYGYPAYVAPTTTNGMAVASMVVSIVGMVGLTCYGLGGYLGIVGAILGHVARARMRVSGEAGDGMALAGVIMGWIAAAIAVLATIAIVILFVWLANQDPSTFDGGNVG